MKSKEKETAVSLPLCFILDVFAWALLGVREQGVGGRSL